MHVVDLHYPALFTHVCLVCISMATKALSDQSRSLFISLRLALSLRLCEFECFAQLAALRPIQLVLCHAAPFFLMLAFQMSQTISSEAPDACFLAPANSGLHRRSLTLNRSGVSVRCTVCLLVGFTLCLCLSVSLCFHGDVPRVQLSCVQYTTPSLLLAGFSKIQTNRWC